jgi:hypothetical protein
MTAALPIAYERDTLFLRLARELAINLYDTESVLKANNIDPKEWGAISKDRRFVKLLKSEMEAWNAANNTPERVRLKSAMLVEEWLLEANKLAHDGSQTLTARIELMKLLKSLGGLGVDRAEGSIGERFSITINLGADQKLQFDKQLPHKVIEHEATPTQE